MLSTSIGHGASTSTWVLYDFHPQSLVADFISSQFPFCALGFVLVPIYVKLTTVKTSLASKLLRVDWVGGFLFIGGLTSFLVGLSWAGIQYKWGSAQVIAPIVVGIAGIIAAVIWEIHGAQEPFLRPSLFSSASALATYACALFQGFIVRPSLPDMCPPPH